MPRRTLRAVTAGISLLLAGSVPVFAAKTDIVILRNGDHITCEVIEMRQGKLQAKTDDAGTLSIEWDKIASITTADQYDIIMRDGSRRLGRFKPAVLPDLQIVDAAGVPANVRIDDIASFERIRKGFLQRLDGSFGLGGSYTKSSGVADLYLDLSAKYRRPAFAYAAAFSSNLTRQPDAPETARYSLNVTYTRYRDRGWFVSGLGLFESNRELGFTFRGTGAPTLGRYLVRARHAELLAAGGIAAGRETPIDAPAVTNIDAVAVTGLSVFTYDYPTTRIDFGVLVFPSLDTAGRVRVNADLKFKREIFKDFYVALTAYDAFDNRPKSASATRNDFGASLSFGWTF